jgi:threonine dehydrogenase-like Zn-dependent dehydrogenase
MRSVCSPGKVRPGDTVAVVGAGAVGLSAILTTGLWGASRVIAIDSNKFRLDKAMEFGATDTVEASDNTVADVREGGRPPRLPGLVPTTAWHAPDWFWRTAVNVGGGPCGESN